MPTTLDDMGRLFRRMQDISITSIPLNPFDVILMNRWEVSTYRAFAQVMGVDAGVMEREISPRAFSFYSFSNETFIIVYNSDALPEKITFGLAHEIGHILHGHISPRNPVLARWDENKLERDALADQFARFALKLS